MFVNSFLLAGKNKYKHIDAMADEEGEEEEEEVGEEGEGKAILGRGKNRNLLQITVEQLGKRCHDLELRNKDLCLKLASTTQKINTLGMQNKTLLKAMHTCSVHNEDINMKLSRLTANHHEDF